MEQATKICSIGAAQDACLALLALWAIDEGNLLARRQNLPALGNRATVGAMPC